MLISNPGVMMRERPLKYGRKVFAFFYEKHDSVYFRLGKGFEMSQFSVDAFSHLSPFKNKSPMWAWFIVGSQHQDQWNELTNRAIDEIRK